MSDRNVNKGSNTQYDFTTAIDRREQGALKWELMKSWNEDAYIMGITPLSVADMEFKTAPPIIEGLKNYLDYITLGYSGAYDKYYGSVMSWMYRRHNWKINREWVVNTPGVVNAFFAAVEAFSAPGDGVIVFKPVYYPFFEAIKQNGRTIVNCPLIRDKDNYYTMDFDLFDELTQIDTNKLLLLCSPHNPVGRVWKKEELERLGQICLKNGVTVISDEIWMDFIYKGAKHIPFTAVNEAFADISIVCTAPSKTFNLAGMATSNIIIPNTRKREEYTIVLARLRNDMVNVLGYRACEIAYNECEDWFEQMLKVVDDNQKLVSRRMSEISHAISKIKPLSIPLSAQVMEGTYVQWMDFRGLDMEPKEMEKFMHEEALFFLDEGYIFGDEGIGFERINLAAPTHVIKHSLDMLENALIRHFSQIKQKSNQ